LFHEPKASCYFSLRAAWQYSEPFTGVIRYIHIKVKTYHVLRLKKNYFIFDQTCQKHCRSRGKVFRLK